MLASVSPPESGCMHENRTRAMPEQETLRPSAPAPARRVRNMAGAWLLVGALTGAASTPPGGEAVDILCFVLAGVVVMPVMGVVLGLLGGGAKEALLSAAFGGALGAAAGLALGARPLLSLVSLGLVNGGLVGATFGPVLRLARRLAGEALHGAGERAATAPRRPG